MDYVFGRQNRNWQLAKETQLKRKKTKPYQKNSLSDNQVQLGEPFWMSKRRNDPKPLNPTDFLSINRMDVTVQKEVNAINTRNFRVITRNAITQNPSRMPSRVSSLSKVQVPLIPKRIKQEIKVVPDLPVSEGKQTGQPSVVIMPVISKSVSKGTLRSEQNSTDQLDYWGSSPKIIYEVVKL